MTRTAVIGAGSHSPGVLAIATRLCAFGIVTISVWNEQDRICVASAGLRAFGLELVVAGTSLSRIFDLCLWHVSPRLLTVSPGFCASRTHILLAKLCMIWIFSIHLRARLHGVSTLIAGLFVCWQSIASKRI